MQRWEWVHLCLLQNLQRSRLLTFIFQFQKIFVINLASRTDRRDAISLAARLTGLQIEFVEAATQVDAKAWPPGAKEVNLNPGGAGCWRSHLNVIERQVRLLA